MAGKQKPPHSTRGRGVRGWLTAYFRPGFSNFGRCFEMHSSATHVSVRSNGLMRERAMLTMRGLHSLGIGNVKSSLVVFVVVLIFMPRKRIRHRCRCCNDVL